jgi:type I restriction enzyme M protein
MPPTNSEVPFRKTTTRITSLPLVFLKHLSERYEIVQRGTQGPAPGSQVNYYTTEEEEISYVLEDPDEYRIRNTFKIPHTASWQYLKDNAEQDDIKVQGG